MKKTLTALSGIMAGLALAVPGAMANTVVKQVDAETLQVVDYSGKPPFKRRFVSQEHDPQAFARYVEQMDSESRAMVAVSERAGPPGKSLPRQRLRINATGAGAGEVIEFARFEESGEVEAESPRMFRGAPGKYRPRLTD